MRRILVVGAGFFGGVIARRLAELGLAPVIGARRTGDVRLDAEDEGSLRAVLEAGDVVVDTAGPFGSRTTRLVRAAMERGCDVIDLSESLGWSTAILALADRARTAGIRVYPGCSAVAAVAGACIRASGNAAPDRVDLFLAPASAETASPATVRAFLASVGRPIRVLREGALVTARGYSEIRRFPASPRSGGLVESAAAVLLPRSWPTLRRADLWVDPNAPLGRWSLSLAARLLPLAAAARFLAPRVGAGPLARRDGVFAVVAGEGRRESAFTFSAARHSYRIATEPAVMTAAQLARGARPAAGVILPDAQLDPDALFARLRDLGVAIERG